MRRVISGVEGLPAFSWDWQRPRRFVGVGALGLLPPDQANTLRERIGVLYRATDDLAVSLNNLAGAATVAPSVVEQLRDTRQAIREAVDELMGRLESLDSPSLERWNVDFRHTEQDIVNFAAGVREMMSLAPSRKTWTVAAWVGGVVLSAVAIGVGIRLWGRRGRT